MKLLKEAQPGAAGLQWLAALLTADAGTAADLTAEIIAPARNENAFFSNWMLAWSRRLVVAQALIAVRKELARSVRHMALRKEKHPLLPSPSWTLDSHASKADLERALLAMDLFPRAVVLLVQFERMPLADAALLLDAPPELVRKAQAVGVVELTTNLARIEGWQPAEAMPNQLVGSLKDA